MASSSTRRFVPAWEQKHRLRVAGRPLVEDLERRALLTITVNVVAGGTLDLNPMSSIFPVANTYDYMAVNTATVPGLAHGTMYKLNGASSTVWGTTTGGTFFAPTGSSTYKRIYSGEGFRYVNNGTGVGTSESIPVTFSNTTGFNSVNDTLVINIIPPAGSPEITQQPLGLQGIAKGNSATLSVTATGNAPLSYQWYQGLSPNAASPISGAMSRTYTTPVLNTTGQYHYWVKVSNSVSSVASQTSTVLVGTPAVVNSGGPYTVTEKGSVTLNATATDPDNGLYLVYAWDFNGNGLYGENTTAFGDERGKNAVFNNNFQIDGPSTRTLSLKVTNDKAVDTITPATLNVTNTAPTALFANDGTAGSVKFYNVADSAADVASMKYSYDFNNDGTFEVVDSTASAVAVPLAYREAFLAGQPVRGRVKDSSGATSPDYLATINGHAITVTTLADTVSATAGYAVGIAGLSLRDAITLAESDPDADHILFDAALFNPATPLSTLSPTLPASATVTNSAFAIKTPITITGPGGSSGLVLAGKGAATNYRAFTIYPTGNLTLENLNVRDFASIGTSPVGGAIYANGPLKVRRSAFYNNTAKGSSGGASAYGGAIAVDNATAVIDNSTFASNAAGALTGSFVGYGGAIAALTGAAVTLRHDTISANSAPTGSGVYVIGLSVATTAIINNTILSGNVGSADYYQVSINNSVTSSGGNNLFGSAGGSPTAFGGTFSTASPGLAALANNGGPTLTMAIAPASPAYNAGLTIAGLTVDQRGMPRSFGAADIGAFEVPLAVTLAPSPATVFPGNTAIFSAAASGSTTPTVQWQVSTNNGASFSNVAGATSTILTFATSLDQNGNLYRAVFTTAAGSVATAAAPLTVSGTVTLAGGAFTVSRSGASDLVTVIGPAGTANYASALLTGFAVRNANVTFNSDLGLTNSAAGTIALDVAADSIVTFATKQHLGTLNLDGRATLTAGGGKVLRVSNLKLGTAGVLDLNDNALIYDYVSSAGQMAAVRSMIAGGRAGGAWTGSGLTSTTAKTRTGGGTTLGSMEAGAYKTIYGASALFAGESVGNAVLVKYALYGDTDFNGGVNFNDFVRLQTGFGQPNATTVTGDTDADGDTDFNDYVLLQTNFGQVL